MAFFRRNKDEDYEDEDEELEEEDRRDRKLARKFKDLRGENKRRRKEPPKPWGKRERILILIILLSTMIISGVLAGLKFSFTKPDFSFDIFKEKTIILEK
jgi:hypothetical protein